MPYQYGEYINNKVRGRFYSEHSAQVGGMNSTIDSPFKQVNLVSADPNMQLVKLDMKIVNGILCGTVTAKTKTTWTVGAWTTIGTIDISPQEALQAEAFSPGTVNRVGVMAITTTGEIKVYSKTANEVTAIAVFSHVVS